ncbi:MAG: iron ABC transporter permease [Bacteroidaceae bacterium]|nr:iron ABC transporter permease [Bacteroidaceae bacterium]
MNIRILILAGMTLVFFLLNIFFGSVHIPFVEVLDAILHPADSSSASIVTASRFPAAVTALLSGAALAASGLLLQTAFRNPLAGPSILGISSGANLGVAIVMLALGGTVTAGIHTWSGHLAVVVAALAGSLLVMFLLLLFSSLLKNGLMLLITGIMMGYITSSAISLLNFLASVENIQSFVLWGMGSFNSVSLQHLPLFSVLCVSGLILALLLTKPLNAMLLGESYAANLGVNMQLVRNLLLLATGLLTAVVTAYCGPVTFLGLATPHVAFLLLGTSNHRSLLPATMLMGALLALLCNLLCNLPSVTVLPLNAITPLLGAPVILYIIMRRKA